MVTAPSQLVLQCQPGTLAKHRLYPVLTVFLHTSHEFSSRLYVAGVSPPVPLVAFTHSQEDGG